MGAAELCTGAVAMADKTTAKDSIARWEEGEEEKVKKKNFTFTATLHFNHRVRNKSHSSDSSLVFFNPVFYP